MRNETLFITLLCCQLLANPNGAEILSGAVQMQTQGNVLEIQASDRSILHWNDFSILSGEITRFIQPNETAAVLNRVIGLNASIINGVLEANGRVILINPNGVIVGKEGIIHVADFIGSTYEVLDLSDWSFHLDKEGAVHIQNSAAINHEGYIQATGVESIGGRVMLVAGSVNVKGTIDAPQGTVELFGRDLVLEEMASIDVSGELGGGTVLIGDDAPGSVTRVGSAVQIHADAKTAGDGGSVILWSGEATQFYGTATAHGGSISGDGGFIEVSSIESLGCYGTVDASAPHGASGQILFDPCDITVAMPPISGPAFTFPVYTPGANASITGASIGFALMTGNDVTINTSPGVGGTGIVQWNVTEGVFWVTANKLTINADSHVTINGAILSFFSGDVEVNSFNGDVNVVTQGTGAFLVSQRGLVKVTAGRNINLLTPTIPGNIRIFGKEVQMTAGGNVVLDNTLPPPNTIQIEAQDVFDLTVPSPITIDAGGSVIMGLRCQIYSANGPILVKADHNIEMRALSAIFLFGTGTPFPITLVVDDQAPTAPQIGNGAFLLDANASIGSLFVGTPPDQLSPVQIFTARRSQNSINGTINGALFNMPGPYDVNTVSERWRVYYPNAFFNPNNPFFTIFYKEPQPLPTILAQTIGQAFIVIEEFAYPPAFYEDHFCITECANAIDRNRKERRECPWIQIDNYRKFYPNRQKYAYLTSDDSPILQPNCEGSEEVREK